MQGLTILHFSAQVIVYMSLALIMLLLSSLYCIFCFLEKNFTQLFLLFFKKKERGKGVRNEKAYIHILNKYLWEMILKYHYCNITHVVRFYFMLPIGLVSVLSYPFSTTACKLLCFPTFRRQTPALNAIPFKLLIIQMLTSYSKSHK